MKLPRAIRLDPSDTFIFERAAEPGEWAVSGAFLFAGCDPDSMGAKERHAFRSGFLGVGSLGFSTLVTVSPASDEERAQAIAALADSFLRLGAPDRAQALKAAEDEIAFAASLCEHPEGALLARRAAHRRGRRSARALPHAQAPRERAGRGQAARHGARVHVPRGRGRGRDAGRVRRSRVADGQDRKAPGKLAHEDHALREFWVSSGHHLSRQNEAGELVATPELMMAWLARPELAPPPEACDAERALHAALLADPFRDGERRRDRGDRGCGRARELDVLHSLSRPARAGAFDRGRLSRPRARAARRPAAAVPRPARASHPAQRARWVRRPLHAARRRAVLPRPAGQRPRWRADAGGRRSRRRDREGPRGDDACRAAHRDAGEGRARRHGRRERLDLLVALGRQFDGDESRRQQEGPRGPRQGRSPHG